MRGVYYQAVRMVVAQACYELINIPTTPAKCTHQKKTCLSKPNDFIVTRDQLCFSAGLTMNEYFDINF